MKAVTVTPVNIDICICTFRRPHVAATLWSLARLEVKRDWKIRVIIADNDDQPSARDLVETTAREAQLHLTYLHAPARNISIARNACLDAATAPFVAFIDDDELASPGWLISLMETMEENSADAVLGPVRAIYRPECPEWLRKADYHSTLPAQVSHQIVTGGTGNVLLRRSAVGSLRFRRNLGRCGGEDTAYFRDLAQKGGRISFAPKAVATEMVPPERESFIWLIKRRFRSGQTYGFLLLESCGWSLAGRAKNAVLAAAKAGFCFGMACLNTPRSQRRRFWSLRAALHAGVTSRLLGKRELEQYG